MTKTKKNDESVTTDSSCVTNLMEAEKRARDIIDVAKKHKQGLLKKARDDSNAEVEVFKKECENNLRRLEFKIKSTQGSDVTQIEKELAQKISDMKLNYKNHWPRSLQSVLEKVTNVRVEYHKNFKE